MCVCVLPNRLCLDAVFTVVPRIEWQLLPKKLLDWLHGKRPVVDTMSGQYDDDKRQRLPVSVDLLRYVQRVS